jgi:hypothetical protein
MACRSLTNARTAISNAPEDNQERIYANREADGWQGVRAP